MLRMPNFMGMSVDSSTLHFAMSHLPSYSLDSSSTIGEIMRQGPHQGAQKSRSTGIWELITISSKLESLIANITFYLFINY